ncbi:LacI family DNA-binding transcriptional regulator [Alpinimonas psychrophila]|uniref:DNA-binding LacI/PurR family transcriptional regulator n=1 Tax=Alpinimonas psychrophila TaxID=748908 RepID=A0A7W3JTW7_9MICO|nr:LacI family DNA-binding transcriptional regulator [Alpinimonas psychrophila]MBA8829183.1 DNA-binding LacI/PurR family transcriptional regulator [Alpinimonas psychrophila]
MTADRDRRRATIHDVARHAGVSITTVSHSLNTKGIVAAATRQRVLDAAAALGYSPNPIARRLRGNRLGVIGLVIRPLDSLETYQPEGVDYFVRFVGAAAVESLDRGFGLMLVRDPTKQNAPAIALGVDGFIVCDPVGNDPVIELLDRSDIPLVTVGRDIERPNFENWLESGGVTDATVVFEHLSAQGAKRIALVTGTDDNAWYADSMQAYAEWILAHPQDAIVYHQDETTGETGGRVVADAMLADARGLPDAVYFLTGRGAAGLQARFQERGLEIPRDLLIVAGSDAEQTRSAVPTITSVDLAPEETARAAVDFLLRRLDDENAVAPPPVQNTLRVRGSTTRPSA